MLAFSSIRTTGRGTSRVRSTLDDGTRSGISVSPVALPVVRGNRHTIDSTTVASPYVQTKGPRRLCTGSLPYFEIGMLGRLKLRYKKVRKSSYFTSAQALKPGLERGRLFMEQAWGAEVTETSAPRGNGRLFPCNAHGREPKLAGGMSASDTFTGMLTEALE